MKKPVPVESASALIDARIRELGDWRGKTLAKVRQVIHEADPEIVEEWKWMGTPLSHDGFSCTGEMYKNHVKMTFPKGASLEDPSCLFNATLEGNAWRAIDIRPRRTGAQFRGENKAKPKLKLRRATSKRAG